jgi:hypothetical protein
MKRTPTGKRRRSPRQEPRSKSKEEPKIIRWVRVNGREWSAAAEFTRECPSELQVVAGVRLDAMATLWNDAEQMVRNQKPGTTQELEEGLRPLVLAYAERVFVSAAESNPNGASVLIPVVLDDVFRPMYGQVVISIWYLAETLGKEQFIGKMAETEGTRQLLWRSMVEETLQGPITKSLGKYLLARLKTRALQFPGSPVSAPQQQPRRGPGRPGIPDAVKNKALAAKIAPGGTNKEAAKILYDTTRPNERQVRNTSTILREYQKKLANETPVPTE